MHVVDRDGRYRQGFQRKTARHDDGARAGGRQTLGLLVAIDQCDVPGPGVQQRSGAGDFHRGVTHDVAVDQLR